MLKVTALTSGPHDPSARYRVRQYVDTLAAHGVAVTEYVPRVGAHVPTPLPKGVSLPRVLTRPMHGAWLGMKLASRMPGIAAGWRSQVTWLGKALIRGRTTLEPLLRRPYVFDVDDAVWLSPPWGERAARNIASRAALVVAGNAYLAEWFSRMCKEVQIIPTAVDVGRYQVKSQASFFEDRPFTIGWMGTSSNFPSLFALEPVIGEFLREHDAQFLVVSNRMPEWRMLPEDRVCYVPWSQQIEETILGEMDVGIMPLAINDWSRGKCSFKMIQYMATGLPVVVTPVGLNAEILDFAEVGFGPTTDAEWHDAFLTMYQNRGLGYEMGQRGRKVVEERFEKRRVAAELATLFQKFSS